MGRGGTRWVPALLYVGPYTPFGFYNAKLGEGRPHDNHFHCPLALQSRCASSRCVQSFRGSWAQTTLTVKQLFVRFSAQFAGPDSGHQASFMIECPECAWVQFWGPQSDSETGTRTREPNLVTRMGAQSSPTSDLNDWGRHCGSQNVEFLWLQNSAAARARNW